MHDAFLRAILENPADDAPRLHYADWLEEHGGAEDVARAEFIRVQCELARTPEPAELTIGHILLPYPDDPHNWRRRCVRCREVKTGYCGYHALRRREKELLDRHGFRWKTASGPGDLLAWVDRKPIFRRGFVAEVTLTYAEWLEYGEQLRRMTPLEQVNLSDVNLSPVVCM